MSVLIYELRYGTVKGPFCAACGKPKNRAEHEKPHGTHRFVPPEGAAVTAPEPRARCARCGQDTRGHEENDEGAFVDSYLDQKSGLLVRLFCPAFVPPKEQNP